MFWKLKMMTYCKDRLETLFIKPIAKIVYKFQIFLSSVRNPILWHHVCVRPWRKLYPSSNFIEEYLFNIISRILFSILLIKEDSVTSMIKFLGPRWNINFLYYLVFKLLSFTVHNVCTLQYIIPLLYST